VIDESANKHLEVHLIICISFGEYKITYNKDHLQFLAKLVDGLKQSNLSGFGSSAKVFHVFKFHKLVTNFVIISPSILSYSTKIRVTK